MDLRSGKRWNYRDEKDVELVNKGYDKLDIPMDVIWLDIEHTDSKKYFTWHPDYFPTPDKMMEDISASKRKLVTIVDPHIKKEEGYSVYTEIRDKGFCTKKINWQMMDDPNDTKPEDWNEVKEIADPAAEAPPGWDVEEDGQYEAPKIENPEYKGEWKPRRITDPNSPTQDVVDYPCLSSVGAPLSISDRLRCPTFLGLSLRFCSLLFVACMRSVPDKNANTAGKTFVELLDGEARRACSGQTWP